MAEPSTWILRDLPGVGELEALLGRIAAHPNPEWAPERDVLDAAVTSLTQVLFGFTPDERQAKAEEEEVDELDSLFSPISDLSGAQLISIMETGGWDVTDGAGQAMRCAEYLALEIIAATTGFIGSPPTSESLRSRVAPDAWGAALEAEARAFRSKPKGKPK